MAASGDEDRPFELSSDHSSDEDDSSYDSDEDSSLHEDDEDELSQYGPKPTHKDQVDLVSEEEAANSQRKNASHEIPSALESHGISPGKNCRAWELWHEQTARSNVAVFNPTLTRINDPTEHAASLFPNKVRQLLGAVLYKNGDRLDRKTVGKGKKEQDDLCIRLASSKCRLYVPYQTFQKTRKNLSNNAIEIGLPLALREQPAGKIKQFITDMTDFFERLPVELNWLNYRHLQKISQVIGAKSIDKSVWPREVTFTKSTDHKLRVSFSGWDPALFKFRDPAYERKTKAEGDLRYTFHINPLMVDLSVKVPDPRDTVRFKVKSEIETTAGFIKGCTLAQQNQALAIGKYVASILAISIGSTQQFTYAAYMLRQPYMMPDDHAKHKPYILQRLIYGGASLFKATGINDFIVKPSDELLENLKGLPEIHTKNALIRRRVQAFITEIWLETCDADKAWLRGCEIAGKSMSHLL